MSEAGPAGPSSTPARSPTTDSDEISESLGRSEVAKVFRHDHRPVLIQDELFGHATEELESVQEMADHVIGRKGPGLGRHVAVTAS